MSLQSWLQNSWLVQHTTNPEEITNLFAISDRDLTACQVTQLPADWRFAIAYNAGLQAATAALAAAGYRATRDNHHYRVIQSLEFTTAPGRKVIDTFDGFRKKRSVTIRCCRSVSDKEADEMLKLATSLRTDVEKWIRTTRPEPLRPLNLTGQQPDASLRYLSSFRIIFAEQIAAQRFMRYSAHVRQHASKSERAPGGGVESAGPGAT